MNEIYNPHNRDAATLPVIYGFNNGGSNRFLHGCLIAEDGKPLGSHCCSDEYFMRADLGISVGSRPDRHEGFRKHYPDGYRMEFVSYTDVESHEKLMAAIKIANEAPDAEIEE